jgi:hypothetical protein
MGILAVAVVLLTACAAPLWGQAVASAQISGLVADPSGAAVPNAKIIATQTETGLVRTTLGGPDGTYVLPNLPVGPYKLEVQASGFETYVQTGIRLQVSDNPTTNVTLRVGLVSEHVEVTANANMVQTQTTAVSQVINQRSIVDLPLDGRQATELVLLSGAATDTPASNSDMLSYDLKTSKNWYSSDTISVGGGQGNGTNYLMDGGDNNDAFSNVNLPFPFPDALQEFSVQTNSLSARYGLHPGAVVNVVTKSGTNQFHGDAFEFVRNGDFNARDFFAATQDTLKRNQFGGTLGGPILKDKLFAFFGYQGTRIRTAPPSSIAHVPTQAVLGGDFSQLESPTCQSSGVARTIINPATGQAFANDFVSPSLFNQQALNLLKYVPTSSDPCGELTYAIPEPQSEEQYLGRVDWNQSAKHNFFGRYFFADYKSPAVFDKDLLLSTQRGIVERSQSMVLGDTYSISPTTLNSFHATWSRLAITRGASPDFINLTDVGVNIFSAVATGMDLGISGYFGGGCGTCATAYFDNNSGQLADDVDIMHGRHHISLGMDAIRNQLNFANAACANGEITFNGQFSGDALVDFMLGLPNSFMQCGVVPMSYRQTYIGTYITDNVRLSKRFNFQVGLRFEPYLPEREIHNEGQAYFFPAAFAAGKQSTVYVNAPPGFFFTGDPGIPHSFSFSHLAVFEPRVGLVWDPAGNGRQTIRAGVGLFYDTPMIFYAQDAGGDAPWGSAVEVPAPAGGFTNPYLGFPGGNPFPRPFPPPKDTTFVPEGAYYNYPVEGRPTYMLQWDASFQRQLTNNWLVSATYIGNKTTHIWTGEEANPGVYIPGMCNGAPCSTEANLNQRRVLSLINPVTGSEISDIWQEDDGGNAEYQGLLVSAQHRFSRNYTLLTNYTWSHCISEGDFQGDLGGPLTQNPYNRNGERGNCGFDLRQIFNLSFVATTPKFANRWTNRLLGDWQLAPIFSIHSGAGFSVWTGIDNSLTGIGLDRPNVVSNPYVRSTTGALQWLNPAAFVPNALGAFGNSGSDSVRGPAYANIDAALSRYFNIKENHRLELRFEFFNLANRVNFSNPDNNIQDSTFGQILGDVSPRILQFALRYSF